MSIVRQQAVRSTARRPRGRSQLARGRGALAGLLLAAFALFSQIAAATPMPGANAGRSTVLGIDLPICGHPASSTDRAAHPDGQQHLLGCARCLCCYAPAIMPTALASPPHPDFIVYAAQVVLPPATAPPVRLAARPPPRGPPALVAV